MPWECAVPDLRPGSLWHRQRVRNMSRAVQGRPDSKKLFQEGLAALDRHRLNYRPDGPRRLQLLWWGFPREHWKAIWRGCRMNFLSQPGGPLAENSPMDTEQISVAEQFVEELILLDILLPSRRE